MIRQGANAVLLSSLSALLLGCSVASPVRLNKPQSAPVPAEVSFDIGSEPPSALKTFAESLAAALAARGVKSRPDAAFRMAVGLSQRDSLAGLTQESGSNPKLIKWNSKPRNGSTFDGCQPYRLRALVTGGIGKTASPALIAEAELDSCKAQDAELVRLANALAAAITGR